MTARTRDIAPPAPWGAWWQTWCLLLVLLWASASAWAQKTEPAPPGDDVQAWLARLHEATRNRAYSGTFVVSRGAEMVSARIVHVCDGREQLERIEVLSGPARITWRRDDEVLTLWPDRQWGTRDRRELLRLFPSPVPVPGIDVGEYYRAQRLGSDRLAGFEAWVVAFVPRDGWRYGYRLWSEKRTGLTLKLQTLQADGTVLEQVAFTELHLDEPLRLENLRQQMEDTRGYRVERAEVRKTSLQTEGWRLRSSVPGFRPVACWWREGPGAGARAPLQCVFSDGLAALSLFFAPANGKAVHARAQTGATRVLARVIGAYHVTAMGEVPEETLKYFLDALERKD
jgi:sigma-E factor negative regulatory protein RseB